MNYTFSNRTSHLKGSAIREIFKYAANNDVISLAGGNPSAELFPNEQLSEIAADVLKNMPVTALQYGISEGYTPLRNTVKKRLKKDNIGKDTDDLLIMSGGQQGIELTAKIFLNEGDAIIVEEPSFIGALNAFRSYNAELIGVPVEHDGMDLDVLRGKIKTHKNIKLIYTIPTFQNPTGITMSVEKRKELYNIALENGIVIIEDNPYGELTFDGKKMPTIKSFDEAGVVVYCSSFSKILAPALRLGYICANKTICEKIAVVKQVSDVHTAMITQISADEFMKKYDIDVLIEKMRVTYAKKCQVMLNAIEEHFPDTVSHTVPKGGLFIWCDLQNGFDSYLLSKKAIEKGVVYVPGNTFMIDMQKPCSAFRLNFSTCDDQNNIEGVRRLGQLIKEL